MSPVRFNAASKTNRSLVIAAVGIIAVVIAIILNYLPPLQREPSEAPTTSSAPPTASQPGVQPPTFDVVRISSGGDTVIAGRSEPGSTVVIRDGETVLGEITADERGEWVFVPDHPLSPGPRRLSLEMKVAGREPILSDDVVALVVPQAGK